MSKNALFKLIHTGKDAQSQELKDECNLRKKIRKLRKSEFESQKDHQW